MTQEGDSILVRSIDGVAQFFVLDQSVSTLFSNLKYTFLRSWLFVFSNNTSAVNTSHDHQKTLTWAMALPNAFTFGQVGWCPINDPAPTCFINSNRFAPNICCVIRIVSHVNSMTTFKTIMS